MIQLIASLVFNVLETWRLGFFITVKFVVVNQITYKKAAEHMANQILLSRNPFFFRTQFQMEKATMR